MAGDYTGWPHPYEGKREENMGQTMRAGLPLPDFGSLALCKAAVSRAPGKTSHEGMGQCCSYCPSPHPIPHGPGDPRPPPPQAGPPRTAGSLSYF